jgi:hypothetical protein
MVVDTYIVDFSRLSTSLGSITSNAMHIMTNNTVKSNDTLADSSMSEKETEDDAVGISVVSVIILGVCFAVLGATLLSFSCSCSSPKTSFKSVETNPLHAEAKEEEEANSSLDYNGIGAGEKEEDGETEGETFVLVTRGNKVAHKKGHDIV